MIAVESLETSARARRRLVALGCAAAALVAAGSLLPLRAGLASLAGWARGAGPLGVAAFAAAQVLCALLLVPGWPLRVGAGLVYGPAWGLAVTVPSSFAGATCAFLAGRRFLRGRIAARIAREPRLAAVDDAVGGGGLWIVFLLRLSPLFPNEVVSYGLGATRVRLRDYAAASFVGMIPFTVAYTWAGALLTSPGALAARHAAPGGPLATALAWGGAAASAALAFVVGRLARRTLAHRFAGAAKHALPFCLAALLLPSAAAAAAAGGTPLARAFPSFAGVPRVELLPGPSPLEPMRELERRVRSGAELREPPQGGGEPWLWVKRDDVADGLVGGNKARKLEFLLGEAKRQGARAVVTSGRYGTHLGLATAEAARRLGLGATIVLAPQPVTEQVRRKLLAMHAAGAELRFHATLAGAVADVAWLRLDALLHPARAPYYIPPSGTSDVGSLGYVNAFFELREQTGDGGLPDEIVVAGSTGGTAAGLLAGACLAGAFERTRVRVVSVTDVWLQGEWLLRREARDAFRAVRDALDPSERSRLAECDFMGSGAALAFVRGAAPAYGRSDAALDAVIALARDAQGVELDAVYSGKAMRHFLERARERLRSGDTRRKLLFWNTYAPVDLDRAIGGHRWRDPAAPWRELPPDAQPLFAAAGR
jgi:uncharacterized membrane protein YdjX (TVP38/TMEM64 family)/1-aminocyclopropane-1-carboxylate deaminase/D-cysteine desulfhydrase-like pyridoxal-dependent ACC family enzyme